MTIVLYLVVMLSGAMEICLSSLLVSWGRLEAVIIIFGSLEAFLGMVIGALVMGLVKSFQGRAVVLVMLVEPINVEVKFFIQFVSGGGRRSSRALARAAPCQGEVVRLGTGSPSVVFDQRRLLLRFVVLLTYLGFLGMGCSSS